MNPDPSKLRHQQHEQQSVGAHQSTQSQNSVREFSSVEELIRFDSEQTPVPPVIAERVSESVNNEPQPTKPWWRRLFS